MMAVKPSLAYESSRFQTFSKDAPVGEFGAGLVRILNGAVDAVAKPEFAGQLEGEVAQREDVPVLADLVHNVTVIVGGQGLFDVALQPEASPEVGLLHTEQSSR